MLALALFLSGPAQAMSLQEAVDGALATQPLLALAEARVAEARARVAEARGVLLPQASATAAVVAQNEIAFNLADQLPAAMQTLLGDQEMEPMLVQPGLMGQLGASVTQPLIAPAGWRVDDLARASLVLTQAERTAQEDGVAALAAQAWLGAAEAHALLEEARAGEQLATELLARGSALVEHGVAADDQLIPFRRALSEARTRVAMAEQGLSAADGALTELTGVDGGADPLAGPAPLPALEAALDSLRRGDLEVAQARVAAADEALTLSHRAGLPVLAAQANARVLDPAPDLGDPFNWQVGLGLQVPLYAGGTLRAQSDGATARLAQARAGQDAQRQAARLQVRQAHGALAVALASLDGSEEGVSLAEAAVEAAKRREADGAVSLMALEQAQGQLLQARAARTQARVQVARAEVGLRVAQAGRP
ncbi:MAG: TolC family protein [Deltaproteobacteria bacterium]|nr:TolC family protein [Deltaproteobacteria bacterium]